MFIIDVGDKIGRVQEHISIDVESIFDVQIGLQGYWSSCMFDQRET